VLYVNSADGIIVPHQIQAAFTSDVILRGTLRRLRGNMPHDRKANESIANRARDQISI